jgi:hypothetical protein
MARPKKTPEELRTEMLGVRMTMAELVAVERDANLLGISPPEFTRRRTLGYLLPAPLAVQREQARLGAMLNRLAVNLNQIARHMNAGRGAPAYLSALIARINALLDEIYGPDHHAGRQQL